jgi:two-component system OmpR family sensor kinase
VSLRLRLLVAVGVVVVLALAAVDLATYSAYRSYLGGRVDSNLRTAGAPLAACLEQGGRLQIGLVEESAPGVLAELFTPAGRQQSFVAATSSARGHSGRLARPDLPGLAGQVLALPKSKRPSGPMSDECADTLAAGVRRGKLPVSAGKEQGKEVSASFAAGELLLTSPEVSESQPSYRLLGIHLSTGGALVVGLPLTANIDSLRRLLLIELAVSAAALIGAVLIGLWLVRIGVKPLVEIEETAAAIVEGDLEARVPDRFSPRTELGRLTAVLNSMIGRLSDDIEERRASEQALSESEQRMRRFLADASHELRTPVSAVSAYAELFSAGADRRPEDLARVLRGIAAETDRMRRLVDDLMLLANLDEGRPLARRPVELVSLSADAVHAAETIGEWPVRLVASEPVEVIGDETRLRQVIDNLLANVRAHTPVGTPATLAVRREGDEVRLEVADRGPGLSAEGRKRLFERFFREDTSRSRSSGGAGLGLAIVRAIVEAHGGRVEVADTPGGGARFSVVLPGTPGEVEPQ